MIIFFLILILPMVQYGLKCSALLYTQFFHTLQVCFIFHFHDYQTSRFLYFVHLILHTMYDFFSSFFFMMFIMLTFFLQKSISIFHHTIQKETKRHSLHYCIDFYRKRCSVHCCIVFFKVSYNKKPSNNSFYSKNSDIKNFRLGFD